MNSPIVTLEHIQFFLLIFVRITAVMALLPVFGSQNIPAQLKVAFSLILTVVLFPVIPLPETQSLPFTWGGFVVMIVKELFVGILMGFVSSFLFVAVQFAGHLIDQRMGFAFVRLVDPFTNAQVTSMGQLLVLVFTIFFLLINGHYFFLLAIQKSFELVPLSGVLYPGGRVGYHLTSISAGIFVSALRLAAPVYVTLFISYLAMGLIVRTVPQINVFFVGLPMQILLGLGTTAVVFPLLFSTFRKIMEALVADIWKLLYMMA